MQVAFCQMMTHTHKTRYYMIYVNWALFWVKCLSKIFDTNLDSGCVALQAPDGAAAFIEAGLRLRMGRRRPEAHTDPQSLNYLLNERGACVRQSLRHQADREVKSQGQWLQVLGQGRWDGQQGKECEGGIKRCETDKERQRQTAAF